MLIAIMGHPLSITLSHLTHFRPALLGSGWSLVGSFVIVIVWGVDGSLSILMADAWR